MAVTYKDIDELTQKTYPTGNEKLPVSDTLYITPAQINGKTFRLTDMTPASVKDNYYLSAGGTEYESASYEIRRYDVSPGTVYALSGHFSSSVTNIRMVLWFDANGDVIKNDYNSGASGVSFDTLKDRLIVAPSGAVTLAINVQKTNSSYYAVKRTDLVSSLNYNDLSNKPTIPNITISSSEPSAQEGSDGDIWIVV